MRGGSNNELNLDNLINIGDNNDLNYLNLTRYYYHPSFHLIYFLKNNKLL
jgi:hypothetical protein